MIAAVYLQVVSVQGQCAGAQHSRYFLNSSLLCLLLFVLLGMLDRKFSLEALSPGRQRPRPQVRAAPYSLETVGISGPAPVRSGRLVLPCKFTLPASSTECGGVVSSLNCKPPKPASGQRLSTSCGSGQPAFGSGSARQREDAERRRLAQLWVSYATMVAGESDSLSQLTTVSLESVLPLFLDRAASTLKRHLGGWKVWASFCATMGWKAGAPSMQQILDFLQGLTDGSHSDRGSSRIASAKSVLTAMSFCAYKLSLTSLLSILASPLIVAWKAGDSWNRSQTKEATPLPVKVVHQLEQAFLSARDEDRWFLGAILAMIWGGLRWSDIQRLDFSCFNMTNEAILGACWRTKSSKSGMVFAFLRIGLTSQDWASMLFHDIEQRRKMFPALDYFLEHKGRPMNYTMALSQFRRCLICYAGLSEEYACKFTLHSLKATILCWANEKGVAAYDRAAQGHHSVRLLSNCISKYGRDDIEPQLRCQRAVVSALSGGWAPEIPLKRGLEKLDWRPRESMEPSDQSDTDISEPENEGAAEWNEASSCASSDGGQAETTDNEEEGYCSAFAGPWVLNCMSGVAHKASASQNSNGLAIACRPNAELHNAYEKWDSNPSLVGFRPCSHAGCKNSD